MITILIVIAVVMVVGIINARMDKTESRDETVRNSWHE